VARGDCARGSLHQDTYYGAIERDGEIKYVVRKPLNMMKESDVENIVDDVVKAKVKQAIAEKGFKDAMAGDIYMNEAKGILIKKVRCEAPGVKKPLQIRESKRRDLSRKEYKRPFYVVNDDNYMMAIYEGGKKQMITALDAAKFYRGSTDRNDYPTIAPEEYEGKKLKYLVRKGTQILMLEKDEESISIANSKELYKRLFTIMVLEKDGRLMLKHSSEARPATEVKKLLTYNPFMLKDDTRSILRVSLSKLNFLVEGYDFINNRAPGDVVLWSKNEYIWSTAGKWEILGEGSSFKLKQENVNSETLTPTLKSNSFISDISQDQNGIITPIKK
jgi:CRISPR-associated endonuclease Csn1